MQSNVMWIFLILITIVLAGVIGAFLVMRSIKNRFSQLKIQLNDVEEIPISETIKSVKKMHLIGVSQTSLEEWETKYQEIEKDLEELKADFDELEETIGKYNYIKHSKQFLKYLEEKLSDIEAESQDVYEGLHKLKSSEQQNSERIQKSVDLLNQYTSRMQANDDEYGVAADEIKNRLTKVQNIFNEFEELNSNGNPLEAAKMVQQAENRLEDLSEIMEEVPTLSNDLENIFSERIKDLFDGYQKLAAQKFQFKSEDSPVYDQIKALREKRKELLEHLERCDIEKVIVENRNLRQAITKLYSIMQKEIDAKTYVDSTKPIIKDFIQHAITNNNKLTIELDHISQSFVLNYNEMGTARNFQYEIEKIQIENDEWSNKLEQNKAVYSEVEEFYKSSLSVLEDIENQQVEIDHRVLEMRSDLKKAERAFDEFEFKMRSYKRYVEKYRLPGLPKEYLDFFFLVTDHIERLGVELGKMKVDTLLLMDYVNKIDQEVQEVERRTNELIDDVNLAEQYIQYTSRYRVEMKIEDKLDEAMTLFNSYRYKECLELVKETLGHIEPNAVDRISDFYYKEHQELKK